MVGSENAAAPIMYLILTGCILSDSLAPCHSLKIGTHVMLITEESVAAPALSPQLHITSGATLFPSTHRAKCASVLLRGWIGGKSRVGARLGTRRKN
jgi:hypothetical protein